MSDECNGGLGEMYDHFDPSEDEGPEWRIEWLKTQREKERAKAREQTIDTYRRLYEKARNAQVYTKIQCPVCGARIVKVTYNHVFCTTRHKDKYWNTVDDERRARAERFNQ